MLIAILIFIFFGILYLVFAPLITHFELKEMFFSGLILFSSLAVASIILAFIKYPRSFGKSNSMAMLGFNFDKQAINHISKGLVFALFTILIIALLGVISGGSISLAKGFDFNSFIIFTLTIFLMATAEELVFRGVIFQALLRRFNPLLIIILSAIVFAFGHGLNPDISWISMINIFLASIFLSYCYLTTLSMWLPISAHFFWNWTQPIFLGTKVSGIDFGNFAFALDMSNSPDWAFLLTGSVFGVEEGILAGVTLLAFLFYYIKTMKPSPHLLSITDKAKENNELLLAEHIFKTNQPT